MTVICTHTPDEHPLRTTYVSGCWRENSYDALSRPVSRTGGMGGASIQDTFGYNDRSEVVLVSKPGGSPYTANTYQYDDIGNCISSTEQSPGGSQLVATAYTANSLNQYTSISTSDFGLQTSDFTPQFDDDGNQTLIQTATGIWQVTYNGENRPILWELANSSTPNSPTPNSSSGIPPNPSPPARWFGTLQLLNHSTFQPLTTR